MDLLLIQSLTSDSREHKEPTDIDLVTTKRQETTFVYIYIYKKKKILRC